MWSNVYLFNDSVSTLDSQKYMTDVNRFLEEGILQAIRNLLPVKSILRDSLQEDEDDGIQITNSSASTGLTPTVASEEKEVKAEEVKIEEKAEEKVEAAPTTVPAPLPEVIKLEPEPIKVSQTIPVVAGTDTLVVDTEKSVGFTGMDSVFGDSGHAELRPMIEEGDNDLKILGESEALDLGEIEDLEMEASVQTPLPLSADDYESL
jgi:hypothetical protein